MVETVPAEKVWMSPGPVYADDATAIWNVLPQFAMLLKLSVTVSIEIPVSVSTLLSVPLMIPVPVSSRVNGDMLPAEIKLQVLVGVPPDADGVAPV